MVDWWFGARWFGIRIGVPLSNNPFHIRGIQTTNPNHEFDISWINERKDLFSKSSPIPSLEYALVSKSPFHVVAPSSSSTHTILNLNSSFWISTLTLLLICSPFTRENGRPLPMCSSISTAQSCSKYKRTNSEWNAGRTRRTLSGQFIINP